MFCPEKIRPCSSKEESTFVPLQKIMPPIKHKFMLFKRGFDNGLSGPLEFNIPAVGLWENKKVLKARRM